MTTPFPENNGWPYTTLDVGSDYNQVNRFPEWSQLLTAKLYDAIGDGPPQPGQPPFDTGRVSDWSVQSTEWADADTAYWRRRDGWHEVWLELRAVGATRTISAQFLMAKSDALRPSRNVLGEWRANLDGSQGGAVLATNGNLYLQANPSVSVSVNTTIQVQLSPWLD